MMPPHDTYIDGFGGSGAIVRRKRPADRSIVYEANPKVFRAFCDGLETNPYFAPVDHSDGPETDRHFINRATGAAALVVKNESSIAALVNYAASSQFWAWNDPAKTLFYFDPPYPDAVRSTKRSIYGEYELRSDQAHEDLLKLYRCVPGLLMISGYDCELYNDMLSGWRKEIIPTTNRAGTRVFENVWLNFPKPYQLHDYRFLGNDFHDRDRIKKKARRWVSNLRAMPDNERYAIVEQIELLKAEIQTGEAIEAAKATKKIGKRAAKHEKDGTEPAFDLLETTPGQAADPEQTGLFDA